MELGSSGGLVGRGEIGVGEEGSGGIFGADGGVEAGELVQWPGDVEGGVAPEDGALSGGVVEVGGFVEDLCGVGEDEEAVGEALGDPEELEIAGGGEGFEVEAGPAAEVRGVAAEVDGDIPDVSGEDADELSLGLTELVVETAENAFAGKGLIVLQELGGEARGGKGPGVEELGEPAAVVSEALWLQQLNVS